MRLITAAMLLALCVPLSACKREVTRHEVAEFHGGTAQAANLFDNSGAVFSVRLAR